MMLDLSSVLDNNRTFNFDLIQLNKKVNKINKKIEILKELQSKVPGLAAVRAIDEFVMQVKFDFQNSLNYNLTIAYSSKESFTNLKKNLFEQASFIEQTLELEKSASKSLEETRTLTNLQRKVNIWFTQKQAPENQTNRSLSKRKREETTEQRIDLWNSYSLEPPTKKADIDETDRDKGKEKEVSQAPYENSRSAEAVKYFQVDRAVIRPKIDAQDPVSKIIKVGQDDLAMIVGQRKLYSLSCKGYLEKTDCYLKSPTANFIDIACAGNFAASISNNQIIIFEKSSAGHLFITNNCLGNIDGAKDLPLKAQIIKVEIYNDWLFVGTKSSEILGIYLPKWKEINNKVNVSEADQKEKKTFFIDEGGNQAIYRVPKQFYSVTPNGGKTQEKGNPSGARHIKALFASSGYLVAGTSAGLTAVFDLKNHQAFRYRSQLGLIQAVGISMDGSLMYCGSSMGMLQIWDLTAQNLRWSEQIWEAIVQIECVSSGAFILTQARGANKKNLYYHDSKADKLEKISDFFASSITVKEEEDKCTLFYASVDNEIHSITLAKQP